MKYSKQFSLILALFVFGEMTPLAAQPLKQSVNIKDEEGTTIEIKPDGTKRIQKTDGTLIEVNPDGSKLIRKADGTTINVKPGDS